MSKYRVYAEILEEGAVTQMDNCMSFDFAIDGALMPDAHQGYDLPIGAVVKTDGVVVPAWVGFDIGCGMTALKLDSTTDIDQNKAAKIKSDIEKLIPVGFNCHERIRTYDDPTEDTPGLRVWRDQKEKFLKQLGTLGGGNHFVEVGRGRDNHLWVVVHSGSRGFGHSVASWYIKNCNAHLEVGSQDHDDYMNDLAFCLQYALDSRLAMAQAAASVIDGDIIETVNRNHNHAELKDGGWIHRKGATHAEDGMMGVIPGNMRDGSFIVRGKGNPGWICSSSHGAGRVYGRKEAKRKLSIEEFKQQMIGVCANISKDTLDESPMAYKNIFEVMELQVDSVDVVDYIRPILNIKG